MPTRTRHQTMQNHTKMATLEHPFAICFHVIASVVISRSRNTPNFRQHKGLQALGIPKYLLLGGVEFNRLTKMENHPIYWFDTAFSCGSVGVLEFSCKTLRIQFDRSLLCITRVSSMDFTHKHCIFPLSSL